jgi:hypothetical protein
VGRELLARSKFRRTLLLYHVTITIAVIGLASVAEPTQPRTANLATLALVLFLGCLAALPRAAKSFLDLTRINSHHVERLASSITLGSIEYVIESWRSISLPEETPEIVADMPLYLLRDIATRSLRERDTVLPEVVVRALFNRLIALLTSRVTPQHTDVGQYWRRIINRFIIVIRSIAFAAVESGDETTVDIAIDGIRAVHRTIVERALPWYTVVELNEVLLSIAEKSLSGGQSGPARNAINVAVYALLANLKSNVPQGDDAVSIENAGAQLAEKGVDAFSQWTTVIRTYPGLIREIAVSAAKNRELGVASGGLFTVGHIPDGIRRLPGLGLRQKTQAIMWAEQFAADALMTIVDAAGEVPTLGLGCV